MNFKLFKTLIVIGVVSLMASSTVFAASEWEGNDQPNSWNVAYVNDTSVGYISSSNDVDYWRLTANRTGSFKFSTTTNGLPYLVQVFPAGSSTSIYSGSMQFGAIFYLNLTSGQQYDIKVYSADGTSSTTKSYAITIE